jgi:hypothetical protein
MRTKSQVARRRVALAVCVVVTAGSGCVGDTTLIVQPPVIAPQLTGSWRAHDLRGALLPTVAERFEDAVSVTEFRLDSVRLDLSAAGRYTRMVAYSEWLNADKSRPGAWELRFRARYSDFGTVARTDSALTLTSDWIQNLVVPGTLSADGSLRLRHGLTPGDSVLDMRFIRMQ